MDSKDIVVEGMKRQQKALKVEFKDNDGISQEDVGFSYQPRILNLKARDGNQQKSANLGNFSIIS